MLTSEGVTRGGSLLSLESTLQVLRSGSIVGISQELTFPGGPDQDTRRPEAIC